MKDMREVVAALSAPLPPEKLKARIDGKPNADGKARFVIYTDAGAVRERLDEVVPGQWSLTLTTIGEITVAGRGKEDQSTKQVAVKAAITILPPTGELPVTREDVGQGKDWKAASSDAFKRAGVRWGIGHEIGSLPSPMVKVKDATRGKSAQPAEDPVLAAFRFQRWLANQREESQPDRAERQPRAPETHPKENQPKNAAERIEELRQVTLKKKELLTLIDTPVIETEEFDRVYAWLERDNLTIGQLEEEIRRVKRVIQRREQRAAPAGAPPDEKDEIPF